MNRVLKQLSQTRIILSTFTLMMLTGASFAWVQSKLGAELLDMQFSGEAARSLLDGWDQQQRSFHLYATLLLDSLYPLAYGGFFAGLAARLARTRQQLAALPALIGVAADFAENLVQALALADMADLLPAKDILTPLKFAGTAGAVALILVLACCRAVQWLTRSRTAGSN